MPIIISKEVLAGLISNNPSPKPGEVVEIYDPATGATHEALYGEPTIVCPGCTNEIDPTCCHCGTDRERHDSWNDGHSFVPMGCTCGYDKSPRVETVRELTETTDLPWDL